MRTSLIQTLAVLLAALALLIALPARAQSIAVTPIQDETSDLPDDVLSRLNEHLRQTIGAQGGYNIIAADAPPDTLRYIAQGALRTSFIHEGANEAVVAELTGFDGNVPNGRGYITYQNDPRETLEARLKAALSYVVAQVTGRAPAPQQAPSLPPYSQPPPPPPPRPYIPPPYIPPPPPPPEDDGDEEYPNRYVIDVGLNNPTDYFFGLFQLGLAKNDTNNFFGLFQGSAFANEDSFFAGPLQFGIGRNIVDEAFYGGLQIALGYNDNQMFRGISQFSLYGNSVYEDFVGLFQLALWSNKASAFAGISQIGLVNGAGNFIGLAQIGGYNCVGEYSYGNGGWTIAGEGRLFVGLGQFGLMNCVQTRRFYAALQVAGFNRADEFNGLLQLGLGNMTDDFHGIAQIAPLFNYVDNDFYGIIQLGLVSSSIGAFNGLLQVGALNTIGRGLYREIFGYGSQADDPSFYGFAQVGGANVIDREFKGVAQVSLGNFVGSAFKGLVQVGAVGNYLDREFYGGFQVGLINYVDDEFYGIAQVGGFNWNDSDSYGMQIGGANLVFGDHAGIQAGIYNGADRVYGAQIGLVNMTDHLRGVQIGLLNMSGDGGLPITPIANVGW